MSVYSTGTTGTVGKYLNGITQSLDINLISPIEDFSKLKFNTGSCIIHLAGIVGNSNVSLDINHSFKVNVEGSIKLAKIALAQNVDKFIFVSTSHVYKPSDNLLNESSMLLPSSIYAYQKLWTELELKKIFAKQAEKLCIVRVFSILDWDVPDYSLGGGIKKLVYNDLHYKLINSSDIRDFLTPRKVAEVLLKIANISRLSGVVNLCSGNGTSIQDAVTRMLDESDLSIDRTKILTGNSENPYSVGDNSKLLSLIPELDLKWSPSKYLSN